MAIFTIFFIILFFPNVSSASDYISLNQSLSGTQKLTSKNGVFELGFFKPGNSSYYYIGIWYSLEKVPKLASVWVANRETPISDSSKTYLKISENGNLVISNSSNPLIWSTNVTDIASKTTTAILLDSGNLVLTDGLNSNNTLWQSIDHPTHTWLPGGRIALNKVTNSVMRLTSWKSEDDPAAGIFSLSIDPSGSSQYFIYWNNTFNYWSSGYWNGHIFSLVPEMTANFVYDFQYVSNATTNYFTYSLNQPIISRFIMDLSGQIKQLTWVENANQWILFWSQPRQQCAVHALCGPYGSCKENALPYCNCIKGFREKSLDNWSLSDYTQGCTRNTQLQCGSNSSAKSEKDKFYTITNTRLPDNPITVKGSDVECQEICLNNCSCTAYAYDDTNGCLHWYGDLLNLQDQYSGSGGGTLFLRLSASELPDSKSNKNVIIGSVVAGVGAVLLISILLCLFILYKRRKVRSKVVEGGLVAYRYSDLQRITKNFSEKLGQGAFGSVFKGTLSPNSMIAVKKLEGIGQGEKQFRTEVSTIGTIQHVNLVRLHGFCSEGTQKLLVYEYMPNSSLDSHLFNKKETVLDWKARYQIALGTARGLTYLHEQCRDCIVHCDIKPENILLDSSFVPKVADFGLAKLIGRDFSRVLTTMRGTRGYLAPEWLSGVAITSKADVYSYGMMLFEIVSGMRNSEMTSNRDKGEFSFFPSFAMSKLMEGDVMSLMDERLNGEGKEDEVMRLVKVACWCIQDEEDMRPSMGQVVKILECVVEVGVPNVPRAVKLLMDNPGNIMFYSESSETKSTSSSSSKTKSTSSSSSKTKSTSSSISQGKRSSSAGSFKY